MEDYGAHRVSGAPGTTGKKSRMQQTKSQWLGGILSPNAARFKMARFDSWTKLRFFCFLFFYEKARAPEENTCLLIITIRTFGAPLSHQVHRLAGPQTSNNTIAEPIMSVIKQVNICFAKILRPL